MLQMPDSGNQLFEVRIYNKKVRAMVKQNQHHHFFDDQWADVHIRNITAHDEAAAISIISKNFLREDGFVFELVAQPTF
tara:strand:- start:49 stop:285 length:237 start_codon:yes stop_codon:yes gene_type:complete